LPEKEKADHDLSFCFHLLSFAVLASIPKRLSHNLLSGTLKEYPLGIHLTTRSSERRAVWRIDFKKKRAFCYRIWALSPFGDFQPQSKRADHDS
jgi:hypothetical protein